MLLQMYINQCSKMQLQPKLRPGPN